MHRRRHLSMPEDSVLITEPPLVGCESSRPNDKGFPLELTDLSFPTFSSGPVTLRNRLQTNRDLSLYGAEFKLAKLQLNAQRRELRMRVTRMAKKLIFTDRQLQKQAIYTEKLRRFDLRSKKTLCCKLKKSWLSFYCLVAVCSVGAKVSANRKRLHQRADFNLKWLYQVLRCAGRIMIIVQGIRRRRAMRVRP